jgi:hypothetical protein
VEPIDLEAGLQALGMTRDSWRALPLLPLVTVAWADGAVQDAERGVIEMLAVDFGVDDDGMLLLRNWLAHPPSDDVTRQGQQLLVELCAHEGTADPTLLDDVIHFARDVARAAGGFFGIGAIDRAEADAIDKLADALGVVGQRTWVRPNDVTFIPVDADQENDGPSPEVHFVAAETLKGVPSPARIIRYTTLSGEATIPVVGEGLVIGRVEDCDIRIDFDARVSRRHCRVFESERKFYVEDLESTTGTWINGQRVIARRLLGGEEIRLGGQVLYFQLDV